MKLKSLHISLCILVSLTGCHENCHEDCLRVKVTEGETNTKQELIFRDSTIILTQYINEEGDIYLTEYEYEDIKPFTIYFYEGFVRSTKKFNFKDSVYKHHAYSLGVKLYDYSIKNGVAVGVKTHYHKGEVLHKCYFQPYDSSRTYEILDPIKAASHGLSTAKFRNHIYKKEKFLTDGNYPKHIALTVEYYDEEGQLITTINNEKVIEQARIDYKNKRKGKSSPVLSPD